jgi:hypothetical protein
LTTLLVWSKDGKASRMASAGGCLRVLTVEVREGDLESVWVRWSCCSDSLHDGKALELESEEGYWSRFKFA